MKRKEAIKKLQNGDIQIHNDLLPSTKEIKKLLKKAFPKDPYTIEKAFEFNYFKMFRSKIEWENSNIVFDSTPIIKLSEISKSKNKNKQIEKQFSELAKEVAETNIKINDIQISVSALQINTSPLQKLGLNKYALELETNEHTKNLDVDFENVEHKLEVGKWYKSLEENGSLFEYLSDRRARGFFQGWQWTDDWSWPKIELNESIRLANPEEVEQAL